MKWTMLLVLCLAGCSADAPPSGSLQPPWPARQISYLEAIYIGLCDGLNGKWSNSDGGSCSDIAGPAKPK